MCNFGMSRLEALYACSILPFSLPTLEQPQMGLHQSLGKSLLWDVTIQQHRPLAVSKAGAVAARAESQKETKYDN